VVVVAVIVVVVELLVVTAASVIGGVVAGVLPAVVHAPNPRREVIRTTAERVSIWFQQYGTWSRLQDPSKPVFPNPERI